MLKIVKRIFSVVCWFIMLALFVLLGAIRVFGYTPYVVTSGSMIPQYPVGSLVYVKQVEPCELKAGDDVSFYLQESVVATHRIRKIDNENQQIYTYGINNKDSNGNPINDPVAIDFHNIIGKVTFFVPKLGYINLSAKTTNGKIILILSVVCVFMIAKLIDYLCKEKE